jgi:8-oxo-dGTP pyrophosphatase MutT (NUDIX family)
MKKWTTLSREVVFRTPWYTFDHDRFRLPDGGEGDYWAVRTGGAVMIVPVDDEGRIVLVRQYRYLLGEDSVELPAGGLPEGTAPLEQAKRELAEEARCGASRWEEIGRFASWNGVTNEICRLFLATGLAPADAAPDRTEEFELLRPTWPEVRRMIEANEIFDGMTLAAFALAGRRLDETAGGGGA